jgi:hypothetical protein
LPPASPAVFFAASPSVPPVFLPEASDFLPVFFSSAAPRRAISRFAPAWSDPSQST